MKVFEKKVLPGIRRSPKYLRRIRNSIRPSVPVKTRHGIIVGFAPTFEYERARVQRVVECIVRGILFKMGRQLPLQAKVDDFIFNPVLPDELLSELKQIRPRQTSDASFQARVGFDAVRKNCSILTLLFYGRTLLFTGTSDEDLTGSEPLAEEPVRNV